MRLGAKTFGYKYLDYYLIGSGVTEKKPEDVIEIWNNTITCEAIVQGASECDIIRP